MTHARDAYVIADAARTMPHTLRRVDVGDEALAGLGVLVDFDDDLAAHRHPADQSHQRPGSPRHPALEHALGSNIQHKAVLELLTRCGHAAGIRKAGRRKLLSITSKTGPRKGERLVDRIMTALDEQTVIVAGTAQPRRSCLDWPTACATYCTNATVSPPKSTRCLMLTLLQRS